MSKFKVGNSLRIDKNLDREGVDWYSLDIYYVVKIVPPGTIILDNGFRNPSELLECITIHGKKLIAHESKFYLDVESGREEKLYLLLENI